MQNNDLKDLDVVQLEIPAQDSDEITREQKIQNEREAILHKLADANLDGLREKVAFILNRFPETRNCDIGLAWRFWKTFEPQYASAGIISEATMPILRTVLGSYTPIF